MRARQALFGHIRGFFNDHLLGLYRFDDCLVRPAQPAERENGARRFAYGKDREIVHVGFGDYDLVVLSPVEAPPLGRVEFGMRDGESVVNLVSGPIDPTTFERAGRVIKEAAATQRGARDNGDR